VNPQGRPVPLWSSASAFRLCGTLLLRGQSCDNDSTMRVIGGIVTKLPSGTRAELLDGPGPWGREMMLIRVLREGKETGCMSPTVLSREAPQ
jgi:hypothetical protein